MTALTRAVPMGVAIVGSAGWVAGLVIGLWTYPPTAWAAAVEIAAPSAVLGGALGCGVSAVAALRDRVRRTRAGRHEP
jgi:hypothetical protein